MEAESLALSGNKYHFDQDRLEALPNFCPWTSKLSPNMDNTLGAGKFRKPGLHPGDFPRRIKSVIVPMEERGCFQLPPAERYPFSELRPPPRFTEGGWGEAVDPNVSGISFCDNLNKTFKPDLSKLMSRTFSKFPDLSNPVHPYEIRSDLI